MATTITWASTCSRAGARRQSTRTLNGLGGFEITRAAAHDGRPDGIEVRALTPVP